MQETKARLDTLDWGMYDFPTFTSIIQFVSIFVFIKNSSALLYFETALSSSTYITVAFKFGK